MTPHILAWIELVLCWAAWAYPFLFRAPHIQKRESITVAGPTRLGLLLEVAAIALAFLRAPGAPRTGSVALIGALVCGIPAAILAWSSVNHLGRQFRIHAGLYVDHELVRTGPYALVRHPIYSSLLAILVATLLLLASWQRALIALTIFVIGTEIRVRSEDSLLASRFGEQFAEYKRTIPAYIPFFR